MKVTQVKSVIMLVQSEMVVRKLMFYGTSSCLLLVVWNHDD